MNIHFNTFAKCITHRAKSGGQIAGQSDVQASHFCVLTDYENTRIFVHDSWHIDWSYGADMTFDG